MDKLNVFHAFSGVDSQLMAEKRVWGGKINVVGTMEVDVDAIISAGVIHSNKKFCEKYSEVWSEKDYDNAREWLRLRNIGYDFEKGKSKLDRMKKDKLKQLYIASVCTKNYGDISLANKVKVKSEIDLFTYSSPCQSFSLGGKLQGLKGTSGLLLECEKFIEINKPKVLLLENVKNLVGKRFKQDFDNWCDILDKLGYNTYWKVLNAKHYGVAQNRERVFALSIRKDLDCGYEFPEGFPLETRLKDILEKEVESKYYLSYEVVSKFEAQRVKSKATHYAEKSTNNIIVAGEVPIANYNHLNKVYDKNGICCTLDTMQGGHRQPKILEASTHQNTIDEPLLIKEATKKGYAEAYDGDSVNLEQPNSQTRRGRVGDQMANTLMTSCNQGVVDNFRIRKLTPRECWNLMDFDSDAFDKVRPFMSDSALYKQAGNSIVVACMEHIFRNLNFNEFKKD